MTENANILYGRLLESVQITGITVERAWTSLEQLLENDRWKSAGDGFHNINTFLATIKCFDGFRVLAEQRKRIAKRLQELDAFKATTARLVGVDEGTIRKDLKPENSGSTKKKTSEPKQPEAAKPENSGKVIAMADAVKTDKVRPKGWLNKIGRRMPDKPTQECMRRGLDQLENTVQVLDEIVHKRPDAADSEHLAEWVKALEKSRTALTHVINHARQLGRPNHDDPKQVRQGKTHLAGAPRLEDASERAAKVPSRLG